MRTETRRARKTRADGLFHGENDIREEVAEDTEARIPVCEGPEAGIPISGSLSGVGDGQVSIPSESETDGSSTDLFSKRSGSAGYGLRGNPCPSSRLRDYVCDY
ncbi:hypothetical protein NDU88_004397 [Pleurodeles waltl]|uniref:Uncharacterized protein n=1 Tax=Pleurodeles waltl TaxID=8319 RepID=A0AAV7TRR5_PLEWA|nr:hypothetical protein NDU88_004397 [Pleurodeles waltl]